MLIVGVESGKGMFFAEMQLMLNLKLVAIGMGHIKPIYGVVIAGAFDRARLLKYDQHSWYADGYFHPSRLGTLVQMCASGQLKGPNSSYLAPSVITCCELLSHRPAHATCCSTERVTITTMPLHEESPQVDAVDDFIPFLHDLSVEGPTITGMQSPDAPPLSSGHARMSGDVDTPLAGMASQRSRRGREGHDDLNPITHMPSPRNTTPSQVTRHRQRHDDLYFG